MARSRSRPPLHLAPTKASLTKVVPEPVATAIRAAHHVVVEAVKARDATIRAAAKAGGVDLSGGDRWHFDVDTATFTRREDDGPR